MNRPCPVVGVGVQIRITRYVDFYKRDVVPAASRHDNAWQFYQTQAA